MIRRVFTKSFIDCFLVFVAAAFSYATPVPGWQKITSQSIVPLQDNRNAAIDPQGRILLEADFSRLEANRASWDFMVDIDLREKTGVEFDFYCSKISDFSSFNIYFKSGDGWYGCLFSPEVEGRWHRVKLKKSLFTGTQGRVKGWGRISAMRISGWRGADAKVRIGLADLSYIEPSKFKIGVLRGDSCAMDPRFASERSGITEFSAATAVAFERAGIDVVEISDIELEYDLLKGMKLLVLPYNPRLTEQKANVLRAFADNGGKILACHTQGKSVLDIIGLNIEQYRKYRRAKSTESPIATGNGYYLPHVWRYEPLESVGHIRDIMLKIEPALKAHLDEAFGKAEKERNSEIEWVRRLPSKKGEWRGFWCHSPMGLKMCGNWDSTIAFLKSNGFNAIVPNLSSSSGAYYSSSVLPVCLDLKRDGDKFEECISACRKYSVECHVWKICWRMAKGGDKAFVDKAAAENRIQVGFDGKKKRNWLCPSHPLNLKLEVDSFLELAKKRPDGIHLDYIRYPDRDHCYCERCRKLFEKELGHKIDLWPKQVVADGLLRERWYGFRRTKITALVESVAKQVRNEFPGVQISAAVFHDYVTVKNSIAQDWLDWCKKGYLDFVCPMNYYGGSNIAFSGIVDTQQQLLKGCKVKMRPGIGISCWKDRNHDAFNMAKQIEISRNAGTDGFVVFNLDNRAAAVLPVLHEGPTSKRDDR